MRIPVIKDVIDRRILVNYRVDPETEAAKQTQIVPLNCDAEAAGLKTADIAMAVEHQLGRG